MDVSEWRKLLKKHHFCRDCQKQDAYTLAGRTFCFECAEKMRKAKAEARKDPIKREKMLNAKREQIARYKEQGRCVRCGKQLTNGKRMCPTCYNLQRLALKKSRGSTPRISGVICWQCNKKPCEDGKRLCRECYEKKLPISLENLKKSRTSNHPWKESFNVKTN